MENASGLARVARTPRPPYYAVSTTTELKPEFDREAHFRLGVELYGHASRIGGFLGLEVFFEDNASVAISFWDSLDAIECWRRHPVHCKAKATAKASWFGATITRIARVEADYGFHLDSGRTASGSGAVEPRREDRDPLPQAEGEGRAPLPPS